MTSTEPQLALSRIVNAPRSRVYEAFTDPARFAAWWGPFGNSIAVEEFAVIAGGSMRWSESFPDEPSIWTKGRIDLTDVVEGELLDGVMRIGGELPGGYAPFETRMRVEFYDDGDQRTRLEVRQWLPDDYVAPSENGWSEAFAKLDTVLAS